MNGSPEGRCVVALVGAGNMAREHCRAFLDVPNTIVTGIHSRTRRAAEALAGEHGIESICDSIAELYESTRADLVVVAVGELATNAVSRACFDYPWTVLLEKPPGYSLRDAEDIRQTAVAAGRQVLVGLNRRFYSTTRAVLNQLSNTSPARFIKVVDQHSQSQAASSGKPPAVVRNWMFANAIHTIDLLRLFARGKVAVARRIMTWIPGAPSTVVAAVDFESGDTGLYEGIWHGPGPWGVTVTVPGQRWEMRPLEELQMQQLGLPPTRWEAHPWDRMFKPGIRLQAAEVVRAALGYPSESIPLDDAVETMRLISEIFAEDADQEGVAEFLG